MICPREDEGERSRSGELLVQDVRGDLFFRQNGNCAT